MPIRGRNPLSMKSHAGMTRLLGILITALGCHASGCAKATVGDVGQDKDAGTADAGPQGDGKDDANPNAKKDGASDAPNTPCDPFTNSGCPSDQKCTAFQSGNSLSLGCGSKDSKVEGDDCTGSPTGDDCGDQLACFKLDADPTSTCHRICPTSGTANACLGTETCNPGNVGLGGLSFCVAPCLPLEQTGCPQGQACYYGTKGAGCAPIGSKQPGDTCAHANDCVKGSDCITLGSTFICSSFCSTASGGTPSCSGASTGGTICAPLGGTSDEANLGSCLQQ